MIVQATYHAVAQARERHPDLGAQGTAEKIEEEVRLAIHNGRTGKSLKGYEFVPRDKRRGGKLYLAWTPNRERVYVVRATHSHRKIIVTVLPPLEEEQAA